MARSISSDTQTFLDQRAVVARDFLSITARDRTTGGAQQVNFWSGLGDFSADVIDPDTGGISTRDFYGSGSLIQIDDIPLVSNLTVQTISIKASQIDDLVQQAVREYDCKQARVEIHRGLFDPSTRKMVAPAECRFVGFVDEVTIDTPKENEDGGVTLTCTSHTQEFTRSNSETRSDSSQRQRDPNDAFFKDAAVVKDWKMFWGQHNGVLTATQ